MSRALPEWIGRTDDTPVPPRVRLRVRDRAGGKCQGLCARPFDRCKSLHIDHIRALILGGENRETNLQLLCEWCHANKTRADVALKSHSYKRRATHAGIKRRKVMIRGWRRFSGEPVRNPKLRRI